MRLLISLALLLPLLACRPTSAPGASPVHDWLRVHADGWMAGQRPDGKWSTSGASGGGGYTGSTMRYTGQSRIIGRVPKEDRPALLAGFRAEMERQIEANGGNIEGSGLSGTEDAPVGWSFDYEAKNGALGGVVVEAVDAEDGMLVVLLTSYEVR